MHVLDGLVLCGMDIRHLHFKERMEKLTKFVRAISRPTRSDLAPIRVKATFRLEHIDRVLAEIERGTCPAHMGPLPDQEITELTIPLDVVSGNDPADEEEDDDGDPDCKRARYEDMD